MWGPDYGDRVEYLRVFIKQLRRKIEPHPEQPVFIVTEPWIGYQVPTPGSAIAGNANQGRNNPRRESLWIPYASAMTSSGLWPYSRSVEAIAPSGLAGKQIDHYALETLVATTTVCSIYRGRDVRTGRQVALKIPHPEVEGDLLSSTLCASRRSRGN